MINKLIQYFRKKREEREKTIINFLKKEYEAVAEGELDIPSFVYANRTLNKIKKANKIKSAYSIIKFIEAGEKRINKHQTITI